MWLMWGKNSTSESLTTHKETHTLEKLKKNQGIAKGVQKMRNDIIAINVKNIFLHNRSLKKLTAISVQYNLS